MKFEEESVWVDFKYEQLTTFCFYCGLIGHLERNCGGKMSDLKASRLNEGQYGEWMTVQGRSVGKKDRFSDFQARKKAELGKALVMVDTASQERKGSGVKNVEVKENTNVLRFTAEAEETNNGEQQLMAISREEKGGLEVIEIGVQPEVIRKEQPDLREASNGSIEGEAMELENDNEPEKQVREVFTVMDQNLLGGSRILLGVTDTESEGRWKRVNRSV